MPITMASRSGRSTRARQSGAVRSKPNSSAAARRGLGAVGDGDEAHVGNRPEARHVPVTRDRPGAGEPDPQYAPSSLGPCRQCSDGQPRRPRCSDDHQRRRRVHDVRRLAPRAGRPGSDGRGCTHVPGLDRLQERAGATDCGADRQRGVLHRQRRGGGGRDRGGGLHRRHRPSRDRRLPDPGRSRDRRPAPRPQRLRLLGADDGRAAWSSSATSRAEQRARNSRRPSPRTRRPSSTSPGSTSRRGRCRSPRSWTWPTSAGVPVIVDAAAQIPPVSNLRRFTLDEGADLAVFSGGKALRGPQSTGLVLGRARPDRGLRGQFEPAPFDRPADEGRQGGTARHRRRDRVGDRDGRAADSAGLRRDRAPVAR